MQLRANIAWGNTRLHLRFERRTLGTDEFKSCQSKPQYNGKTAFSLNLRALERKTTTAGRLILINHSSTAATTKDNSLLPLFPRHLGTATVATQFGAAMADAESAIFGKYGGANRWRTMGHVADGPHSARSSSGSSRGNDRRDLSISFGQETRLLFLVG